MAYYLSDKTGHRIEKDDRWELPLGKVHFDYPDKMGLTIENHGNGKISVSEEGSGYAPIEWDLLPDGNFTIGSGNHNTIVLNGDYISGKHASIRFYEGKAVYTQLDINSVTPTMDTPSQDAHATIAPATKAYQAARNDIGIIDATDNPALAVAVKSALGFLQKLDEAMRAQGVEAVPRPDAWESVPADFDPNDTWVPGIAAQQYPRSEAIEALHGVAQGMLAVLPKKPISSYMAAQRATKEYFRTLCDELGVKNPAATLELG